MYRGAIATSALVGAMLMVSASPARADDKAVIKGKVVFKGDTDKYPRHTIPTDKDPNCAKSKAKIGTYDVILNKKTDPITIRNVLVSVKEGLGDKKFTAPSEPAVLTQYGCEYSPHVMGVMAGQPLRVLNGDDTNHNIHFLPKVNEQYNFTQPKKDTEKGRELTLQPEDVFHVKCDVHPWMGCWIQVFTHPFYAVTGDDGTFEIKGLPPGKYVVEAWHEKFGTTTMTVEVAQDETKEADLTFDRTDKE